MIVDGIMYDHRLINDVYGSYSEERSYLSVNGILNDQLAIDVYADQAGISLPEAGSGYYVLMRFYDPHELFGELAPSWAKPKIYVKQETISTITEVEPNKFTVVNNRDVAPSFPTEEAAIAYKENPLLRDDKITDDSPIIQF